MSAPLEEQIDRKGKQGSGDKGVGIGEVHSGGTNSIFTDVR